MKLQLTESDIQTIKSDIESAKESIRKELGYEELKHHDVIQRNIDYIRTQRNHINQGYVTV